jgi:hypothetical protein
VQSDLTGAVMRRTRIQDDLRDLQSGRGCWQNTDIGAAARDLSEAGRLRCQAETFGTRRDVPWRVRRTWRKDISRWSEQEQLLQDQWRQIGGPVLERLSTELEHADRIVDHLTRQRDARRDWLDAHPELEHRLRHIDRELAVDSTTGRARALGRSRTTEGPELGIGLGL